MNAERQRTVLFGAQEIERTIARLAQQILEPQESQNGPVLLGVRRGGSRARSSAAPEKRPHSAS